MVLSKLMPAGTFGAKPGTFGDQIKEMTFCLLLAHCALYTCTQNETVRTTTIKPYCDISILIWYYRPVYIGWSHSEHRQKF